MCIRQMRTARLAAAFRMSLSRVLGETSLIRSAPADIAALAIADLNAFMLITVFIPASRWGLIAGIAPLVPLVQRLDECCIRLLLGYQLLLRLGIILLIRCYCVCACCRRERSLVLGLGLPLSVFHGGGLRRRVGGVGEKGKCAGRWGRE